MCHILCALALSLVAAYPWLLGLSYSKGNDFFYWIHFAWLVGPNLLRGELPEWTMLSGCGQPAFNLDHIPDAVLQGLLTLLLGLEGGIRATVVLCFVVGGLGTFTLSRTMVAWRPAALVAVLAYMAAWNTTLTADFYVYTSNLLQYALLPWVVLFMRRACAGGVLGWHLGAALVLALCALANPQTAIKVTVYTIGWVVLEFGWRHRGLLRQLAVVGIATAWLAASHVVIALLHRSELYTFGKRGLAAPRGLGELFYIPFYALDRIVEEVAGWSLVDIRLAQLVDSPYLGLGVIAAALCTLWQGGREGQLARVAAYLAGLFLLAYFVSSWTNPSEWVGAPRKMFFAVSFSAALLAACGVARALEWSRASGYGRWGPYCLVMGIIGIELLGAKTVLYAQGSHRLALTDIPQVRFWREAIAPLSWNYGERFYTIQADLAFMLFPALVGRPIANRVHQRDYTAEFFSYQDTLNRILLKPAKHWPQLSEYLSLANIRYLEVPRDGFSGRLRQNYPAILTHLADDAGLSEVARRNAGPEDAAWFRHARGGAAGTGPIQVVFANDRARLSFIPQRTFAIIGNTLLGQKLFEQIALQQNFDADACLYLLIPDKEGAQGLPLDGYLVVGDDKIELPGVRRWTLPQVQAIYANGGVSGAMPVEPTLIAYERHRMAFDLAPGSDAGFLFVSLQRFVDWHVYDGAGNRLPVFKAGGGLTGLYLPPDCERVELRYERPAYKSKWRAFSLAGWVLAVAAIAIGRIRGLRV